MVLAKAWSKGPQYFHAHGAAEEVYSYYQLPAGVTTPSIDQAGPARWNSSTGGFDKPVYLTMRGRLSEAQIDILKRSGAKPIQQSDYLDANAHRHSELEPAPV